MPRDLDHWQEHLASHFEELAARRHSGSGSPPVFALEHGLDDAEIEVVSKAVRTHVRSRRPSWQHRLPWVVYAAEVGYDYSGYEYWQTFEAKTPGWDVRGDRSWVRKCYHWFQREYGGAHPSGEWADWFTIICWPITHAILPKDLQRQLARVLYEVRRSFSQAVFTDRGTLGQLVAARSWTGSSRFQHLVQETELVGQIAAALLLEGESATDELLDPRTLRRISRDLDQERQGREWLRAARRSAKERAKVRGLAPAEPRRELGPRRTDEARQEVAALGIEPRLVLQPLDVEGTSWRVSIEIPDLSSLCRRFPGTQRVLKQSRCRVAGYEGRPIARGRFLYGSQRLSLSRWPVPDEVFLRFEQSHPDLEFLLKTECLLRPGPPWVFRIASDGFAYECRSLRVRPGQRYVILSTRAAEFVDGLQPVDLQCRGIRGTLLSVPTAPGARLDRAIQDIGLTRSRLLEVWPAGLAPAYWDGEGSGEWLAGERVTLGIQSDHTLSMLRVSLEGQPARMLELTGIAPGEPTFLELPPLPVGLHTMRFDAVANDDAGVESLGHLQVAMRTGEAQLWAHGVNPSGPLLVRVDPVVPTLEQLWDGQVDVDVLGPHGREVICDTALVNRSGDRSIARIVHKLKLPITATQWKFQFENNFRKKGMAQSKYDVASACRVDFIAGILGTFTLWCEREFTPLRWALVGERNRKPIVRLIDDSGSEEDPTVFHHTLERPASEIRLDCAQDYEVSPPGGLYLARQGDFSAGIIVVPTRLGSLGDLRNSPKIPSRQRSLGAVVEAVDLCDKWATARSSGDILSVINRRKTLRVITRYVVGLIGGEGWARTEPNLEELSTEDLAVLVQAVTKPAEAPLTSALWREAKGLVKVSTKERVDQLARLARIHGVMGEKEDDSSGPDNLEWMSEFALRLASNPRDAAAWAAGDRRAALTRLMEIPVLARAARFVVLATHAYTESGAMSDEVYRGWTWN